MTTAYMKAKQDLGKCVLKVHYFLLYSFATSSMYFNCKRQLRKERLLQHMGMSVPNAQYKSESHSLHTQ
jgi:hypothetical protein